MRFERGQLLVPVLSRPIILLAVTGFAFLPIPQSAEAPYPPLTSSNDLRIINRRFVSEILFENTDGHNYLTLIVTHGPGYWAFKSSPHAIHIRCNLPVDCLREARHLDNHLRSGWNLGLVMDGSWIREILYLKPPPD